jgi:hypothetical protein
LASATSLANCDFYLTAKTQGIEFDNTSTTATATIFMTTTAAAARDN